MSLEKTADRIQETAWTRVVRLWSNVRQYISGSPKISLMDMTLNDITDELAQHTFTSEHMAKTYLKRIEEVNPVVHAVTEVDPTAVDQACKLDLERANGELRRLLLILNPRNRCGYGANSLAAPYMVWQFF